MIRGNERGSGPSSGESGVDNELRFVTNHYNPTLTLILTSAPPRRLIIIIFIGLLFLSFAFSFVHQLRNPNLVRNARNNNANSHQYTSAFTYDDESAPFDRGEHFYPPPPGMPPVYHDDHQQRRYDLDAKDPNLGSPLARDEYHYNDHDLTRAESSRSAANRQRRSSQDTLTDGKQDEHIDKTPQI